MAAPEPADTEILDRIAESIAKSTGLEASEFTDATQVADLGVDSIMAIEIVSVAKSDHGIDLPAKFVFEFPTIGDLRQEFGGASQPVLVDDPSSSSSESEISEKALTHESSGISTPEMVNMSQKLPAQGPQLQGSPTLCPSSRSIKTSRNQVSG